MPSVIVITATSVGIRDLLAMVLIGMAPMTNDAGCLPVSLVVIRVSVKKCLIGFFVYFKIEL
jgi:hypothetical protein